MKSSLDLNRLLAADPRAADYFARLSGSVQEQVRSYGGGITSFERLKDCAEQVSGKQHHGK